MLVGEISMYPVTAHDIVDVVAKHSCLCTDAGTEAKLCVGNEAGPFVVLLTGSKGVAVDESSDCDKN